VLLVALAQGVTDMSSISSSSPSSWRRFLARLREGLTPTAISGGAVRRDQPLRREAGVKFDFDDRDRFFRPVFLLVLGYMTAYWGGKELLMRRRLRLLRDLAAAANLRLGIDHARDQGLHRCSSSSAAGACVLVSPRGTSEELVMYRLDAGGRRAVPQPLTAEAAQALLGFRRLLDGVAPGQSVGHPGADAAVRAPRPTCSSPVLCHGALRAARGLAWPALHHGRYGGSPTRTPSSCAKAVDQIAAVADKLALVGAIMAGAAQSRAQPHLARHTRHDGAALHRPQSSGSRRCSGASSPLRR